jgi:hypothetical protein
MTTHQPDPHPVAPGGGQPIEPHEPIAPGEPVTVPGAEPDSGDNGDDGDSDSDDSE